MPLRRYQVQKVRTLLLQCKDKVFFCTIQTYFVLFLQKYFSKKSSQFSYFFQKNTSVFKFFSYQF